VNAEFRAAISKRLRMYRFAFGDPDQAQFGQLLGGFSVAQIHYAESGAGLPSNRLMFALSEHGASLNWLALGEGAMFRANCRPASEYALAAEERAGGCTASPAPSTPHPFSAAVVAPLPLRRMNSAFRTPHSEGDSAP